MKRRNIFWGIFLLLSAAFIIASQVVSFGTIGVWSILATVFLAAILIPSIIKLEFFGIFIPLAFLYMIYDEPFKQLPDISPWILLSAAVLLGAGFSILFRKRHRRLKAVRCAVENSGRTSENIDDNNPYARVSLGSSSKYLHADALQSGRFEASLGELEVYFDAVQLSPAGAEVSVDCNLASMKLYIPKDWNVIDKISSTLGEVNAPRRQTPAETAPRLTLTGNVKLGSIEIHYI